MHIKKKLILEKYLHLREKICSKIPTTTNPLFLLCSLIHDNFLFPHSFFPLVKTRLNKQLEFTPSRK